MDIELHAACPLNAEYTLCGDAFDGFDSGDLDEAPIFANKDQTITCLKCRRVIDYCKSIKGYKL